MQQPHPQMIPPSELASLEDSPSLVFTSPRGTGKTVTAQWLSYISTDNLGQAVRYSNRLKRQVLDVAPGLPFAQLRETLEHVTRVAKYSSTPPMVFMRTEDLHRIRNVIPVLRESAYTVQNIYQPRRIVEALLPEATDAFIKQRIAWAGTYNLRLAAAISVKLKNETTKAGYNRLATDALQFEDDILPLVHMSIDDRRYYSTHNEILSMSEKRLLLRLHSYQRQYGPLPFGLSRRQYLRYLLTTQIIKHTHKSQYQWHRSYSATACKMRNNLTTAAIRAIVNE